MNPEGFWIVAAGVAAVLLYGLWSRPEEQVAPADAFLRPESASDEELVQSCQACEALVRSDAKDHPALAAWGRTLYRMAGRNAFAAERERLSLEAQEKFEAALDAAPGNGLYAVELAEALLHRAGLIRGGVVRRLLMRGCELCEGVEDSFPKDTRALNCRAGALLHLGRIAPDKEADALLALAEETYRRAAALARGEPSHTINLALALLSRARLKDGEERRQLILRASDCVLDARLKRAVKPWTGLVMWAHVLFSRTKYMPGEETEKLLAEAEEMFQASLHAGADRAELIEGWGVLHWARGDLHRAKEELLEDAAHGGGPAAYNVACLCARLGEIDECRLWLERSREPGFCMSRDQMATERELENVRGCEWFQAILRSET